MKTRITLLATAAVGILPMVAFADPAQNADDDMSKTTTSSNTPTGDTTTTTMTTSTTPPPTVTQQAPTETTQVQTTTTTAAPMPMMGGPVAPETVTPPPNKLGAPSNAFEITGSAGYTQGFGSVQSGLGVPSVAGAGAGLDLGLGYRIDPRWQISINGQYQGLDNGSQTLNTSNGLTGTISAQYHFAPEGKIDPWMEVGTGWRWLWEDPNLGTGGPTILSHGPELGRARVGVDFRTDENVALGPVVGADANLFLWRDAAVTGPGGAVTAERSGVAVPDPRVSTFIYAGLQGRFDIGGQRSNVTPPSVIGSR